MNYNLKCTGLSASDELRTYVEKALAQAQKLLHGDSTVHCDVELELAPHSDSVKCRAEFTLVATGMLCRASQKGSTIHEAIDLAAEELKQELRKNKQKRVHFIRRGAARVKEYLRGWRKQV